MDDKDKQKIRDLICELSKKNLRRLKRKLSSIKLEL